MPQLTPEQDRAIATTPTEELLSLVILQPENIRDMLHAYQLAKCCNVACIFVSVLRDNQNAFFIDMHFLI